MLANMDEIQMENFDQSNNKAFNFGKILRDKIIDKLSLSVQVQAFLPIFHLCLSL